MNDVTRRALRSSLFGIVALAALLFIPAGTLDYWQAWLFMAVFVCASGASTVYLAIHDPKLLERRMNVGPWAEKEPAQKIIMVFTMLGFIAMLVFFALLLILPVLIWRLLDEERYLRQNLAGYTDYQGKVKYRLVPFLW